MFPPINPLRHGPGIKFRHGLAVDVPAYNFFKAWARHKISSWPGVDVPAYNFSKACARHKISSWPGGRYFRL